METCLNCFKEAMKLKEVEAREYSPLALAYLGDAVYELAIRTFVITAIPRLIRCIKRQQDL